MNSLDFKPSLYGIKKALLQKGFFRGGLWEIRTLDLFRVKEAL